MKILFISNGDAPDYQNDMVFHGGRNLLGADFVDVNKLWYMYDTKPEVPLYGRGFTLYGRLPDINVERDDIEYKIKNNFFDKIIYGSCNRNLDYLSLVMGSYPVKDIIFIDGEDFVDINYNLYERGIYYKRELITKPSDFLHPINFSIPKELIVDYPPIKIQKMATIIPGDISTYIYDNQEDYYGGYQKSFFGITTKKGGWDCLRHYEILMNGCIPLFPNLEECDPYTLTNFPKDYIIDINKNIDSLSNNDLLSHIDQLLEYTRKNLTTISLIKYILEH